MLAVLLDACEQRFGADGAEIATFIEDTLRASFGMERVYVPASSLQPRGAQSGDQGGLPSLGGREGGCPAIRAEPEDGHQDRQKNYVTA